ncbi:MAG: carboxypeptidase-like regulatory domain-containing protein [Muribaculaceae bacterium]|nr:carboxypeptidase-like regulatory domain-containing protein [Muribaculaceae bacterium]
MKKSILLITAIALASGAGAYAYEFQKKDASDLRVYVDPGHGGFGAGDRHMGTIKHGLSDAVNQVYNDTTGFFESNTNLWKCFGLVDKLHSYGLKFDASKGGRDFTNNIVMSRVKNVWQNGGPDITEISREVYDNNFDFFISVHSNAHVDGNNTNYPAFFVRGENRTASVEGSDDAARIVWPYAYKNEHSCWSFYSLTNPGLYYDIDFWSGDYALTTHHDGNVVKGYYAVLRHNTPGFLVEGYFHTYQPARHRAMNPDVCRHEGESYARGIADIFGIEKEKTGEIYGIVRDKHEKFIHNYYHCSAVSPDALKPLNNVKVQLLKDNQVIKEYTTDDEWNGAFLFKDLEEGDYYLRASAEGYKDLEEEYYGPYTVQAAAGTYPRIYLENEEYVPPTVIYFDYPDEVDSKAFKVASAYNFTTKAADVEIPALEGKNVKRFIARGENLYVLAHDSNLMPTLLVLDAATLAVKAEVSTEGTEGSMSPLSDIQVTSDGVLIGCANELCHIAQDYVEAGETFGVCNIYKWENDDKGIPAGAPSVWFTTSVTANFFRAHTGYTMAYTGTSDEGVMYLPSASTYYERKVWLNYIDIANGEKVSESFVNDTRDGMNMDALGEDYTITVSPVKAGSFIVNSAKMTPMQFAKTGYAYEGKMGDGLVQPASAREAYFVMAGQAIMAVADMDGENHAGTSMLNITDGLENARPISTANTAMEASAAKAATAARPVISRDNDGNMTAANIELYALRGNKITHFTTAGAEQPLVRGNWAYGLKSELDGEDSYTLTFSLTDAAAARIELLPDADSSDIIVVASGEFEKGENSVSLDANSFSGNRKWQVVVENGAVPTVQPVFVSKISSNCVTLDLNPESQYFGNAYVGGFEEQQGVFTFSPALEQENSVAYQKGEWLAGSKVSPFRMSVLPSGTVLLADWSDPEGGIYKFDPANPDAERASLFQGTINPNSGEWTCNGKVIGGSTSGLAVYGTGEDTRLFSFQEDYPSDYSLSMVCYNIGTEETISTVPDVVFSKVSPLMINGMVDLAVNKNYIVAGQSRSDGNNSKAVPVFVVFDFDGNILLNSGNIESIKGGIGNVATTPDGKLFAYQDNSGYIHVGEMTFTESTDEPLQYNEVYSFNLLAPGGSVANGYQIAFDPSGNLYVGNRSSFRVFALPQDAVETATPARAEFVLNGKQESIENVAVDQAPKGSVEYFNLQGIRVNADNMPAGVYIRRQGGESTKVFVK